MNLLIYRIYCLLLIFLLIVSPVNLCAQILGCTDSGANNYHPGATVEEGMCTYGPLVRVYHELYYEDDGFVEGYPEGYRTWRIYAELEDENDKLVKVVALPESPLFISSTDCNIWNHELGASFGSEIDENALSNNPSLAYDSWLTINQTNSSQQGVVSYSSSPEFDAVFNSPSTSESLLLTSGDWNALEGYENALPDSQLRVLIAQITCKGTPIYNLNILTYNDGLIQDDYLYSFSSNPSNGDLSGLGYHLNFPEKYCTNPTACNYSACPHPDLIDNNSCIYGACLGCTDAHANNFDPYAQNEDNSCTYGPLMKVTHYVYYEDDGTVPGYPEGAKTYRIYAELKSDSSYFALATSTTSGAIFLGAQNNAIWNHPLGGKHGDMISSDLFTEFPALEYDSFITIGRATHEDPGADITSGSINFSGAFDISFETNNNNTSNNLFLINGNWWISEYGTNSFGLGSHHMVLLAQITAVSEPMYHLNFKIADSDETVWIYSYLEEGNYFSGSGYHLSFPEYYCFDENACNYNAFGNPLLSNIASCEYNSCATCTDPQASNYDPTAINSNNALCIYPTCGSTAVLMKMYDSAGDGWQGGNYKLFTLEDGQIASGSLMLGEEQWDTLYVIPSCIKILIDGGEIPEEISWSLESLSGEILASGTGTSSTTFISMSENCSTFGCTNPWAPNYNSDASWDDESCILDGIGCMDPNALNYNSLAATDDNSCIVGEYGCTDIFAANYWSQADYDPGNTCIWGDYHLEVKEIFEAPLTPGYPENHHTCQLIFHTNNPANRIEKVMALPEYSSPISISSVSENSGNFWNSEFGGISSDHLDPTDFNQYPSAKWDSFFTIGMEYLNNANSITVDESLLYYLDNSFDNQGLDLNLEYGSWNLTEPSNPTSFESQNIMLAQITSPDAICGQLNLSLKLSPEAEVEYIFHDLEACHSSISGCMDPFATNYNELAQVQNEPCLYSENYNISVEEFYVDDGTVDGYPPGNTTYRIYLNMEEADDRVLEVFSNSFSPPFKFKSSCGIWNHPLGSSLLNSIDNNIYDYYPALMYDSYLTIGESSGNNLEINLGIEDNALPPDEYSLDLGFNSSVNDSIVLSNFSLFTSNTSENGLAGDSLKVLLAQITSKGVISGGVHLKIKKSSDCLNIIHLYNRQFSSVGIEGCLDEIAMNYNACATVDDGSCEYSDCESLSLEASWICEYDQTADSLYQGIEVLPIWAGDCQFASLCASTSDTTLNQCVFIYDVPLENGTSTFIPINLITQDAYQVDMTVDFGSFTHFASINVFPCIPGCTDAESPNFNSEATVDDNSCQEAICTANKVVLNFTTNNWASELGWTVTDPEGNELYHSSPMENNSFYSDTLCLEDNCYTLNMSDSWGDGWNGAFYELFVDEEMASTGTIIAGETTFDFFEVHSECAIDGCTNPNQYNYNPFATIDDGSCYIISSNGDENNNPSTDTLIEEILINSNGQIEVGMASTDESKFFLLYIYNSSAQVMSYQQIKTSSEATSFKIDISSIASGVYYLQILGVDFNLSKQFVVIN